MPKKCESCKYYRNYGNVPFEKGICTSQKTWNANIVLARDECDKEGNGTFVHYEPKTPTAGATFGQMCMAMVARSGGLR